MRPQQRDVLIDLSEVLRQTCYSRSKWYQLIAENEAPAQIKLGSRSVWSQNAISSHIESLKAEQNLVK